jgi:hypothetical protein
MHTLPGKDLLHPARRGFELPRVVRTPAICWIALLFIVKRLIIRTSISRLTKQIETETAKGGGFFGFGGKDDNAIGRWNTQLATLKEILADVEAGKNPVYDVNTTNIGDKKITVLGQDFYV